MGDIAGLVDALYSRLLLRDVFGKVVPGSIIIFSISVITFSPADVGRFIEGASFFPVFLLIGFAWIVAFAVQAMGEVTGLIRYHSYRTNSHFYTRRKEFLKKTDVQEHQQLERLVVIKEACGNGYLALVSSAAIILVHVLATGGVCAVVEGIRTHWYQLAFFAVLVAFLAKMHFIHVARQTEYMDAILNTYRDSNAK